MKKLALLIVLAAAQVDAGCTQWWVYGGAIGKYNTYRDHDFYIDPGSGLPEQDIPVTNLTSYGGEVGVGVKF